MLNSFLVFLGAVLLVVGIVMVLLSDGCRSWPTTTGTVTESYVVEEKNGWYPYPSYYPVVEYQYMVDGRTFHSDGIKYLEDASVTDPYVALAIANKYPVGSTVTVHYDPNNPDSSLLVVGQGTFTFIMLIVGGTLLTIGAGGVAWSRISGTEVSVGRAMGSGRGRLIDPTSGPSYNFDATWMPCHAEAPAEHENVLWRGRPVRGAYLLSLGRVSMLGFLITAVMFAVPLSITGVAFDLNSLIFGTLALLVLVILLTGWWARKQGKLYPETEYILTDSQIIAKGAMGQGGCKFIPLVNISQVLIARTLVDRIYKTGSLVVSNTARADLICVKEPSEVKRLIEKAMVKAWERKGLSNMVEGVV